MQRDRAKRPVHRHALLPAQRIGLAAVGIIVIAAGCLLLVSGGPGTTTRLGRVAGIMILLGVVAVVAAAIGHV